MKGQIYSVSSGLLAALASLCGKFSLSSHEAEDFCQFSVENWMYQTSQIKSFCSKYLLLIRIVFFTLMIVLNCAMWTTFTKALRYMSTSLEATIINTASNFFFTAIIGQVFLGEMVTGLWWMGTILILCGLLIMHHSKQVKPRKPGTRIKSR